nr:ABC transporter substrate-binding protein [Streptomyces gossypii]
MRAQWLTRIGRTVGIVAATAGLLATAACGSDSEDDSEAKDDKGSSSSDSAFPRTVKHAMDSATLDESPKRIVALDMTFVDATLALEGKVVGYTTLAGSDEELPDYFGEDREKFAADAEPVGTLDEPSLEKIAALEPDLILSAKVRHEKLFPQLQKIAPTVFSETTGGTWKENLNLVGEALGKEKLAEQKVSAFEKRATTIGDSVRKKEGGNPEVSVVRFVDGPTRIYQENTYTGVIMNDLGFDKPDAAKGNDFNTEISDEEIKKMDADDIFITTYADEGGLSQKTKDKFEANPLWKQLEGEIHEADDAIWMSAVGLYGANRVLDDSATTSGVAAAPRCPAGSDGQDGRGRTSGSGPARVRPSAGARASRTQLGGPQGVVETAADSRTGRLAARLPAARLPAARLPVGCLPVGCTPRTEARVAHERRCAARQQRGSGVCGGPGNLQDPPQMPYRVGQFVTGHAPQRARATAHERPERVQHRAQMRGDRRTQLGTQLRRARHREGTVPLRRRIARQTAHGGGTQQQRPVPPSVADAVQRQPGHPALQEPGGAQRQAHREGVAVKHPRRRDVAARSRTVRLADALGLGLDEPLGHGSVLSELTSGHPALAGLRQPHLELRERRKRPQSAITSDQRRGTGSAGRVFEQHGSGFSSRNHGPARQVSLTLQSSPTSPASPLRTSPLPRSQPASGAAHEKSYTAQSVTGAYPMRW